VNDTTVLMSAKPLKTGYQLSWYTIKAVLGHGGFGITYLAHDNNLDREVAIKEYLPTSFACRLNDHSVNPITRDLHSHYQWGLDRFLTEARTLAKFKHKNIVGVHAVFEKNSTAYMVMDYETGDSLSTILRNKTRTDQAMLERIFFPIFDGLINIHNFGFIHRDIKPANIYIRSDMTPVLIDFGSARQTSVQSTGDMTSLVSQGYTPLEQYSADYGHQGPWTDIYSLSATLFHTITGAKPADSVGRSARKLRNQEDPVPQLIDIDYPGFTQTFLDAINQGLALQPEHRPQTLAEWRSLFLDADHREITRFPVHPTATHTFDNPQDHSNENFGLTQMFNDPTQTTKPRGSLSYAPARDMHSTAPRDHHAMHPMGSQYNTAGSYPYTQPPQKSFAKKLSLYLGGAALLLCAITVAGYLFVQMQTSSQDTQRSISDVADSTTETPAVASAQASQATPPAKNAELISDNTNLVTEPPKTQEPTSVEPVQSAALTSEPAPAPAPAPEAAPAAPQNLHRYLHRWKGWMNPIGKRRRAVIAMIGKRTTSVLRANFIQPKTLPPCRA